jgi:hypothetical protein
VGEDSLFKRVIAAAEQESIKKVGASRVWVRVDPELKNPAFRGLATGSPIRWAESALGFLCLSDAEKLDKSANVATM